MRWKKVEEREVRNNDEGERKVAGIFKREQEFAMFVLGERGERVKCAGCCWGTDENYRRAAKWLEKCLTTNQGGV